MKLQQDLKYYQNNGRAREIRYPFYGYSDSWTLFRTLCDESITISNFLNKKLSNNIPIHKNVLDIGCGDGSIINKLANNSLNITLIEPNKNMLDKAMCYKTLFTANKIISHLAKLNEKIDEIENKDVIIASHVLYMLNDFEFRHLIDYLPKHCTLLLIVDHPESIFNRLWPHSAPIYFDRTQSYLEQIFHLNLNEYLISTEIIESALVGFHQLDLKNKKKLISFMSYSDLNSLSNLSKNKIESIIEKEFIDNSISCNSMCVTVTRK